MVSLQPLLGDSLLLLRLLFVTENKNRKKSIAIFRANRPGSKEVDIIVVISCGRSSSATKGKSGAGLGELLHSGAEGLDVIVPEAKSDQLAAIYNLFVLSSSRFCNVHFHRPAQGMSVLGCGSKSLVDLRVSLAWHIPDEKKVEEGELDMRLTFIQLTPQYSCGQQGSCRGPSLRQGSSSLRTC